MNTKRALTIEKMIAKFLNWKRIAFSGSKWHDKEDLRSDDYLGQVKATEMSAIKIAVSDVSTLERNALKYRKEPAFIIHFDRKDVINSDWVMVPISHFKDIMWEPEEGEEVE